MKATQFYTTSLIGFVCLVLSAAYIMVAQSNRNLQARLQGQQETINKGTSNQQVFQNIIRDIAPAAPRDEKVSSLLSKYGFTVNVNHPAPTE